MNKWLNINDKWSISFSKIGNLVIKPSQSSNKLHVCINKVQIMYMVALVTRVFSKFDSIELRYCIFLNQSNRYACVKSLFVLVSRLGDGVLWYSLMATLPVVYGTSGVWMALHTLATGLVCLLTYKWLKKTLVRERPCISFSNIKLITPALDQYSFPSGHTMHAVTFSMLLCVYLPQVASLLWFFTVLIAMSRVILGLHYPSDVAAGAGFGFLIGWVSLTIVMF